MCLESGVWTHLTSLTCRAPCNLQDKLREYEKQIQELTAKLSEAEKEKSTYELKCGEMEKVHHLLRQPQRCSMLSITHR